MAQGLIKFKKALPATAGGTLVAEFVSAITNLSTAKTAEYAAQQSEAQATQTINAAAPHNAVYVTPDDMTPAMQAAVARSSVDAHLKKVQAQQISAYASQQLAEAEAAAKQNYKGRRVRVTVIDKAFQPLEAYWFSNKTGRASQGVVKYRSVKGIIDDLSLRNNTLLLRPTLAGRLFIPDRKYIIVYVVNPANLQPAVEIGLL